MENTCFKINPSKNYNKQWLAYSLHSNNGTMLYIGVSNILGIFSLSDVKKHPMFSHHFPEGVDIFVQIYQAFSDKREGHAWKWQYLKGKSWPVTMSYFAAPRGKVAVKCIDTREVFSSITDCANAHGISASNLSKHLKGHPSFRTVGGKRYEHAKYYRSDTGLHIPY